MNKVRYKIYLITRPYRTKTTQIFFYFHFSISLYGDHIFNTCTAWACTVTGITEITMEITEITIKGWGGVMLGVVGLVDVQKSLWWDLVT